MRPAYVTRCPDCMVKVEIPDIMQEKKVKIGDKVQTVKWFDPDAMISKFHTC